MERIDERDYRMHLLSSDLRLIQLDVFIPYHVPVDTIPTFMSRHSHRFDIPDYESRCIEGHEACYIRMTNRQIMEDWLSITEGMYVISADAILRRLFQFFVEEQLIFRMSVVAYVTPQVAAAEEAAAVARRQTLMEVIEEIKAIAYAEMFGH